MKKVLIGVMLLSLLAGCGVKTHSSKEKQELIKKAYGWSSEPDKEAKAKLDKILGDLNKEAEKGNKKAIEELEKWEEALPIGQINEEIGHEIGKW